MAMTLKHELHQYEVVKYFKEQYGYVTTMYAAKVLRVGRDKFRSLRKEHDLEEFVYRAPITGFTMKMYKLDEIYSLRDKLAQTKREK